MSSNMFVDIHVLQNVPPSNLNRDDTGSPKTAVYGGFRRARVSSQSWKKAMRDWLALKDDDTLHGLRTRNILDLFKSEINRRGAFSVLNDEERDSLAREVVSTIGFKPNSKYPDKTQYLVFVSKRQITDAVDVVEAEIEDESHPTLNKNAKKAIRAKMAAGNSVDLAAFGRMIADDTDLRVDAAVQVAHAIGTDAVQSEFDYFTAVDDFNHDENEDGQSNAGAGMIGTIEYDSATLYRYANVSLQQLKKNLDGDEDYERVALENCINAFIESMPSGKQNTFAAQTLPSTVIVEIRDSRPLSYVTAFEKPVRPTAGKSITELSTENLRDHMALIEEAYGAPLHRYVIDTTGIIDNGEKTDYAHISGKIVDALFTNHETEDSTSEKE